MVGDPGIEPGMGHPGGVTVRCRTLQPVARSAIGPIGRLRTGVWIRTARAYVNRKNHRKPEPVLVFMRGAWHGVKSAKTGV
jgi:hypothetical protein